MDSPAKQQMKGNSMVTTEQHGGASTTDGGPAFPINGQYNEILSLRGMSLRDYFAIHGPLPTEDAIATQRSLDRGRNPHNDSYKPPLRSEDEIKAALRYEFADAMLKARETVAGKE